MTNAQKFTTAGERARAFMHDFCTKQKGMDKCHYCSIVKYCDCCPERGIVYWLEMQADEDNRPLPCPFCGSRTEVCIGYLGRPAVDCRNPSCHYVSCSCDTDSEAIIAHNKIVRAMGAEKCIKDISRAISNHSKNPNEKKVASLIRKYKEEYNVG